MSKYVQTCLPDPLHAVLKQQAEKENRSVSNLVRTALVQYLAQVRYTGSAEQGIPASVLERRSET